MALSTGRPLQFEIDYRDYTISVALEGNMGSGQAFMGGTLMVMHDDVNITAELVDEPHTLYAEGENLAMVMRLIDKRIDGANPTTDDEPLSLKQAHDLRTQYRIDEAGAWREFLDRLRAMVPSELDAMVNVIVAKDFDKFIGKIVRFASLRDDGWMEEKIWLRDATDYGIESQVDATRKLTVLKRAWVGVIEVDWKIEDDKIRVYFRAIELVNARLERERSES